MLAQAKEKPQSESDRLEAAADAAIADVKSAARALILANEFLEWKLATKVSAGYLRGVRAI
jgi:hypothetical protein